MRVIAGGQCLSAGTLMIRNMVRKIVIILFLLIATVIYVYSENTNDTIAILDFSSNSISQKDAAIITDTVTSYVIQTKKYVVIDKNHREDILSEMQFSYSGCTDVSCQLEIGKMLSASFLITGSIGKIGEVYILNMNLLDVESGSNIQSVSSQYNVIDSLIADCKNIVLKLLGIEYDEKRKNGAAIIKKNSIDISPGVYIGIQGINMIGISGAYTRNIIGKLSLGVWGGGGVEKNREINPLYGIKVIYGNKVDSFAVSLNLGIFPGIGVYFKNFFLNFSPWFLFAEDGFYIESGYSISF